jgi:hypothetical protein
MFGYRFLFAVLPTHGKPQSQFPLQTPRFETQRPRPLLRGILELPECLELGIWCVYS